MHAELPFVAALCALLLVVPAVRYVRKAEYAMVALVAWLWIVNVVFLVDSIIWSGNVMSTARAWCNLSTKVVTGLDIALPACCLCICIDLDRSLVSPHARPLPRTAKSKWIVQFILCFLVPVVYMLLSLVPQDRRFDIIEDIGCRSSIFMSTPAILLLWFPPWIISILTIVYAWLAFYPLLHRTSRLSFVLGPSQRSWKHLLPIFLSLSVVGWTSVVSTVTLDTAILSGGGVHSWPGLAQVHAKGGEVRVSPLFGTPASTRSAQFFAWWSVPVATAIVLGFTVPFVAIVDRVRTKMGKPRKAAKTAPTTTMTTAGTAPVLKLNTNVSAREDKMSSPASTVSTVRFGPGAHDFFTIPDFSQTSPSVSTPAGAAPIRVPLPVHAATERKESLPSFLPIGGPGSGRDREDSEDLAEVAEADDVISAFTDFERGLPTIAGLPLRPGTGTGKRPSETSAVASTHNSCISVDRDRKLSVPQSCRESLGRHISVSSARLSARCDPLFLGGSISQSQRPSFARSSSGTSVAAAAAAPAAPSTSSQPQKNRFGMLLGHRHRERAPSTPRSEYELELSSPPRAYRPDVRVGGGARGLLAGLGRGSSRDGGSGSGAIFMTIVKESA